MSGAGRVLLRIKDILAITSEPEELDDGGLEGEVDFGDEYDPITVH